jgi:hypothetical protein
MTANIHDIIKKAEQEAATRELGRPIWLAIFTATIMTIEAPGSMNALFQYVTNSEPLSERVATAEFMREIGFRCLVINGVCT